MTPHLLAPLALYLAAESQLPAGLKLAALALILHAVYAPDRARWAWLAALLVADIALAPWKAANHSFVLLYMTLLAHAASRAGEDRDALLARGARGLFALVMGLATLHKLASPRFVSGEYFTFMLMRGALGSVLFDVLPRDPFAASAATLDTWLLNAPPHPAPLRAPALLLHAGRALAWLTILAEAALALIAARASTARVQLATLLFLPALVLLRPELLFASTLATLVLWMTHDAPPTAPLTRAHRALWPLLTLGALLRAAMEV
jgi:hypothetical protein